MTVSSQTNNATFVGNGVTKVFPLPFRFFANGDVFAYFIDPTTGASTPMVLGTDYTLAGAAEPEVNGNAVSVLTTTVPLANGRKLYVERIMQEVQSTDIVNQGEFFASTHEDVFDRLTMLIQQANANSQDSIRVAIGDPEPQRLLPAAQRANLLLGFDSLGQPIATLPASDSSTELALRLANDSDPTKGASLVGFSSETVYSALSRTIEKTSSVIYASEFGLTGDGSDETAKIVLAVDAAYSNGNVLYWPPGEYVATGPVPNFYSVTHEGPGVIKNGGSLPISPNPSSVVQLYVSTAGSNSNLGLSAAQPFLTIGAAISSIPQNAVGTWTVNIAAGVYAEGINILKATNPNLNIIIQGPTASFGAQTVTIEGVALGTSTLGLYAENVSKIAVRHVIVQNFVRGGLYFAGCNFAQIENVKAFNSGTSGSELVRANHSVLVATGCQLDGNNASLNGFVCYHGFMSVLGASTVTKCTGAGALYAESSGGHFDTNLVSNCPRGLYALQGGFPTISGGSITNCTSVGIEADQGSYIVIETAPTFSGNTTNIIQTINTGISGKIRDDKLRTAIFANNDALEVITQGGGAFMMQLGNNGLTIPGGAWNSRRLILGTYNLWIDASGRLRIKNGAPTSDTDGVIVGTQT